MIHSKRIYWVSNERGYKDAFTVCSLSQVKSILQNEMKHILKEDGYVCGGYNIEGKKTSTISNGEFRIVDNKAKYFQDYTEIQNL